MPAHTRLSMFVLKISCQKVASTRAAVSGGAFAALVIAITPLNTTHGRKGVAPDPGKGRLTGATPGADLGTLQSPASPGSLSSTQCRLQYDSRAESGVATFVTRTSNTARRPPYWIRLRDDGSDP